MTHDIAGPASGPRIHRIRDVDVILDDDLAAALGLETKRLNETVKRNEAMIDERHRFLLSDEEFRALRSQDATSKDGRGGRRYPPWAFTERGVTRVVTFVNTPSAIRASDLIVDTFLTVQKQVAAGRRAIAIPDPSKYHVEAEIAEESRALGKRLMKAINGLLDTVIDIRTGASVKTTAQDLTARALENVRERLREKGLENLKLEAEIQVILREAEKIAEDVEGKKLENLEKRIDLVQKLILMYRDMEPDHVVQLLEAFEAPTPRTIGQMKRLPPPDDDERGGG